MSSSASIKSFTLNLNKTYKGNPKPLTLACVYSNVGVNGIGYVLAVDNTITEIKCFNEGIKGQHAFMNTDKIQLRIADGVVESFRLGFSDQDGELRGFMMQGAEGDDIVVTSNWEDNELEAVLKRVRA